MTAEELILRLGVPLGTFVFSFASGLIPVVSAEVYLVAVAAIAPGSNLWLVALLAALGQMVAKAGMYYGGRGALRLPSGKRKADLEAVQARVERWRSKDVLVLVSALVGLPPFFAISILAGTLRFPFPRFMLAGFAGRLLRFALVVAAPQLGRWIVGGAA